MPANRTFEVKALSRVEGEGALYVKLDGDRVEHVELNIYEPPRFFEAFLRGREVREVPDITARICGICPVAYQMSACHKSGWSRETMIRPRTTLPWLRVPRTFRISGIRIPSASASRGDGPSGRKKMKSRME